MSRSEPACVLITGASRGLGAALALEYAAGGRILALTARNGPLLERVAEACRARGAEVHTHCADLTLDGSLAALVERVEALAQIDLLIANAGVFDGRRDGSAHELLHEALAVVRTNLEGTMRSVDAVLPGMTARRSGRIALISSLAARHPLADAPAYSASKAGMAAYGAALDEAVAPLGIAVSVVLPGHIDTDQARLQSGRLPLLMGTDVAARRIKAGLDRGKPCIVLPRRLALLISLGALLPRWLRLRIGRSFRFHVTGGGAQQRDENRA